MSLLEDDQIIQFRETGSIFRCHSQTRIVQPLKTSLSWTALCYTGRMPLVDGALLHGHDASQQGTQQAIDMFLAEVCTGLPPNIVATPAPQRRARCKLQATEDGLPRRSSSAEHPDVQVGNYFGEEISRHGCYQGLFCSPLGSSHRKAVWSLFTANCPKLSVEAMDIES
jgi:hypothetical protein